MNGQVTLKHVEIGTAGVLPPDAGISGVADLQAKIQSNGQTLNAQELRRLWGSSWRRMVCRRRSRCSCSLR
ncbi:hypothetical protein RBB78_19585 [Tunturiibacter empetritectus]|uniref:hypothetical protein n=1 Tax=Tunturiibacter empetritectus TaxID=3069691 RepID=UPI003D9B3B96